MIFQKYGHGHWDMRGTSKYNRTLSVLAEITVSQEHEQVMRDVLETVGERINWKMLNGRGNRIDKQLISALRTDGYEIVNGKVIPAPPLSSMGDGVGPLKTVLEEREWHVAKEHLTQALDNFQRGNWAACNSQLRSLLEEVFNCIAKDGLADIEKTLTGGNARKQLETTGVLSQKESQFIQSWFNILHTSGAHPGLSTQEDTRWRLHVTAATAYWAIRAIHSQETHVD